ncbi:MAG: ankyrin repeat protein, partial [Candidatus Omnitrophota bacterium]
NPVGDAAALQEEGSLKRTLLMFSLMLGVGAVFITYTPRLVDLMFSETSSNKGKEVGVTKGVSKILNSDEFKALMKAVDESDSDNQAINVRNVLNFAIENDSEEIIQFLVEKGFEFSNSEYVMVASGNAAIGGFQEKIKLEDTPSEGTPLMKAIIKGNVNIVRILLENGADVNDFGRDSDDTTPLMIAAREGNLEIVTLLLDDWGDVHESIRSSWTNALIEAINQEHKDIVELLLKEGANVNPLTTPSEGTPLMKAIIKGNVNIVRMLLENGADVSGRDSDYTTPLIIAAREGNLEIVTLLLDNKADANTSNSSSVNALNRAVHEEHKDIIELLLKNGAKADYVGKDDYTILVAAASTGNVEIGELLLDYGAKNDVIWTQGGSSLMIAASNGHADFIEMLIKRGSKVNLEDSGYTALSNAAYEGKVDAVRVLLSHGADFNARTSNGESALDMAKENEHEEVISLLEAAEKSKSDNAILGEILNPHTQNNRLNDSLNESSEVGGIDFNRIDLDRQGAGVDIQFDDEAFQSLFKGDIQGFSPVIINFAPLSSVLPLLGLAPREEEYEVSAI